MDKNYRTMSWYLSLRHAFASLEYRKNKKSYFLELMSVYVCVYPHIKWTLINKNLVTL
jgi:hypothetical protein